MTKKIISEQDQDLFREATRGIKPLSHSKIELKSAKQNQPSARKKIKEEPEIVPDLFSDYESLPSLGRDDLMEFARSGLQNKTLRNLKNGKYNIEAILDLHGQTVLEARQSLSSFLSHCHQKDKRHVLIIHGKGHGIDKPVLKNKLNHWLRQTELVLAFCSATLRDGRSGSLYVLLKGRS